MTKAKKANWKFKRLCIVVFCGIVIFAVLHQFGEFRQRFRQLQFSSKEMLSINELPLKSKPVKIDNFCPGYYEFQSVDFTDFRLRSSLCYDKPAYTVKPDGGYAICEVRARNPLRMLANSTAYKTFAHNVFNKSKRVVIYGNKNDEITLLLQKYHDWESGLIKQIISMAKTFPTNSVTFLDIGCNIGTYTMQARAAGLPVVALDANIRNIVRVHMAAKEMNLNSRNKLKVFWAIISEKVGLYTIDFDSKSCNVGSAGFKNIARISLQKRTASDNINDTIPVASAKADDLLPYIHTRNIVMKLDIETKENLFIRTAKKLLDTHFVAVVQSEIHLSSDECKSNAKYLFQFFNNRNYSMYDAKLNKIATIEALYKQGAVLDCFWIHENIANNILSKQPLKR